MATPNGHGGWDLTDEDVAEVMAASFPDAAPDLLEAVTLFAEAAAAVNIAAKGMDSLDWQVAANVLAILRKITTEHIGPLDASLVRHLYLTAPHGETELDGLGVMAVRRSRETKQWLKEEALGAVLDKHMEERGGEIPEPWQVLRWLLDAAAVDYLRVTHLRGLQINPENYRVTAPGKPKVTFQ